MNKNFVYAKGKFFFLIFFISFLLVSVATAGMVFTGSKGAHSTDKVYESSSPYTTYFYVDPLEVRDITPSNQFLVTINVTGAPASYAWEVLLNWNSSLLEWFYKREGDFLKRGGAYPTTFATSTYNDANLKGEMVVGCSLQGNVTWASGDGWLCSLGFRVKAYGSCVLNLTGTRLYDYLLLGSPAYTYYPNLDSFFYNQPFHNIAVTNVTAQPTLVEPNGSVTVDVTIKNEGNFTETSGAFNVTVYADKTAYESVRDILNRTIDTKVVVGDEITVGTKTDITLDVGANTTLTFTWNVTGVEGGNYTISAEARRDDDTRDNLFIDGTVTLKPTAVLHDIAVTNVVPSSTEVTVGESVTINVTVKNDGVYNETFDVTLYYDTSAIATQTDITVTNGTSKTLAFTWVTAGVPEGTYTIKAEASVVEGETDTADNTFIDGTVKVRGAQAPSILPYVGAAIVVIIAIVIAVYILRFRRPGVRR